MTANSPSAYSLSMMLHGAFVAALLFTAFAFRDQTSRKSTEIFELVAGEGDNWAATEAPAAGTPEGISFTPEPAPVVQAAPEPAPIAPPVEPSPIQAVAPPKEVPVKTAPPEKTFQEQIAQTMKQKERQIIRKHRQQEAAREKREAAARAKAEKIAAENAKKKMTLAEFQKLNGQKTTAAKTKSGPVSYDKISTKGIAGGVAGGTTDKAGAGGTALSRAEQDQLGTYFALLKQRLKAAHEKPFGVSDSLSTRVSFYVAANGTISQIRITKSSGNTEYDQSVLAAFRAVNSIGPRPDGRGDSNEATFNIRDTE